MKREDQDTLDAAGYDDLGGCKKAIAQTREMIERALDAVRD